MVWEYVGGYEFECSNCRAKIEVDAKGELPCYCKCCEQESEDDEDE
jgi:hypothetical protein